MLHVDPRLAEVPGGSTEQLESLARSIEAKKRQLEADIHAYIRQKQHELHTFQQELIAQYREMECAETQNKAAVGAPEDITEPAPVQSLESSTALHREEKAKRTKVHKREKELFGLVTPIFLPLLDASDSPKEKEKKRRQKKREEPSSNSPPKRADDADQKTKDQGSPSKRSEKMEVVSSPPSRELHKENHTPDSAKKTVKRPAIKKSSLRNSSEKRRRKRVSLVIDGQTVLPADQITEPPLMSPSETTASSASASTTSLEDTIDPRLRGDIAPPVFSPPEAMHHSLDFPTHLPSVSPTKHTGHTLTDSPVQTPIYPSPPSASHLEYEPPQSTTRTYLDPSPSADPSFIPRYPSAAPIYATSPDIVDEPVEEEFRTYVGGISGSGVDDVDQVGSLGYPSSVGASYLESYIASRPLSVRMAAAEKADLSEGERRRLMHGNDEEDDDEAGVDIPGRKREDDDDDDMEIVGSMEDF